jgi:hypothetical protein
LVLQAYAIEHVEVPVGKIDHLLHRALGPVVARQERQLLRKFRLDRLLDEREERLTARLRANPGDPASGR